MTEYKTCMTCGESKELEKFHKHAKMKEGRLNKCSSCVHAAVAVWRKKNPESRQKEYQKRKPQLGITRTRETYLADIKKAAKGRKASLHEYSSKRRVKTNSILMSELDLLAQTEAADLRGLREQVTGIKWHIDHIVPLSYKNACGLHNAYNLQVVPSSWNIKKGNRNMAEYFPKGKE